MKKLFAILFMLAVTASAQSNAWVGVYGDETSGAVLPLAVEARIAEGIGGAANAMERADDAYSAATNALEIAESAAAGTDTNATDEIARASIVEVGAVASNALAGVAAIPPQQSWTVWNDAATNYIAKDFAGARTTNASFSALLQSILVATNSGCVVEIGPSHVAAGNFKPFYIDSPVVVSNFTGFTLRGRGNYGTTISPAYGYECAMFVLTNMSGICRFENIRFQAGTIGDSANTNPCINAIDVAEIIVRDCEFDSFAGTSLRHRNTTRFSAWNAISATYFVGKNTNGFPVLDIGADGSAAMLDYIISGNHFHTWSTNTIVKIAGANTRNVQFSNNRVGSFAAVVVDGISVEGGYGHTFVANAFQAGHRTSKLISFCPAASNDFHSTVAANNFGLSYGTNAIYANADAHGVNVFGNTMPAAKVRFDGPNVGGYVLQGYGTNSTTAARGDDARLSDARTPTAHSQDWSTITGTPDTVSGYGITDALTEESDPAWDMWRTDVSPGTTNAILPDGSLVDISALLEGAYDSSSAETYPQAIALADGYASFHSTGKWIQAHAAAQTETCRFVRAAASLTNAASLVCLLAANGQIVYFQTNNLLGFTTNGIAASGATNAIFLDSAPNSTNWNWKLLH